MKTLQSLRSIRSSFPSGYRSTSPKMKSPSRASARFAQQVVQLGSKNSKIDLRLATGKLPDVLTHSAESARIHELWIPYRAQDNDFSTFALPADFEAKDFNRASIGCSFERRPHMFAANALLTPVTNRWYGAYAFIPASVYADSVASNGSVAIETNALSAAVTHLLESLANHEQEKRHVALIGNFYEELLGSFYEEVLCHHNGAKHTFDELRRTLWHQQAMAIRRAVSSFTRELTYEKHMLTLFLGSDPEKCEIFEETLFAR